MRLMTVALILAAQTGCATGAIQEKSIPGGQSVILVDNQTGEDLDRLEYCSPLADCTRLGSLDAGAKGRFTIDHEPGLEKYHNRVLIAGFVTDPFGKRQVALTPVFLNPAEVKHVVLTRRDTSSRSE
jgi:hypothetical protein